MFVKSAYTLEEIFVTFVQNSQLGVKLVAKNENIIYNRITQLSARTDLPETAGIQTYKNAHPKGDKHNNGHQI